LARGLGQHTGLRAWWNRRALESSIVRSLPE
jgi:hypothetical protein